MHKQSKSKQKGSTLANATERAIGSQRGASRADGPIDVDRAIDCSSVTALNGKPYPIQFRNQGAIEAWTRALSHTEVWPRWAHHQTTCSAIRQEIQWQMDQMHPLSLVPPHIDLSRLKANRRRLAVEVSTNLKYHLAKGTVIEATPALENLLTNSDIELALPMSMVAPPFPAQYLRFGETAMRCLTVPSPQVPDLFFDGVFCFFTELPPDQADKSGCWKLELIYICKRQDRHHGHVGLLGNTDRGNTTVGQWLDRVLGAASNTAHETNLGPMHAALSYVVKVFLYMALKQARAIEHREYDEALRRAASVGDRKRGKILHRAASLYNGILVGPDTLPQGAESHGSGSGVTPHWRRGHFRMQAYGPGWGDRKLIFVAPVLINADQLQGEAPAPKPYRADASAVAVAAD